MTAEERRINYQCDITYTNNSVSVPNLVGTIECATADAFFLPQPIIFPYHAIYHVSHAIVLNNF